MIGIKCHILWLYVIYFGVLLQLKIFIYITNSVSFVVLFSLSFFISNNYLLSIIYHILIISIGEFGRKASLFSKFDFFIKEFLNMQLSWKQNLNSYSASKSVAKVGGVARSGICSRKFLIWKILHETWYTCVKCKKYEFISIPFSKENYFFKEKPIKKASREIS